MLRDDINRFDIALFRALISYSLSCSCFMFWATSVYVYTNRALKKYINDIKSSYTRSDFFELLCLVKTLLMNCVEWRDCTLCSQRGSSEV